MSNNRFYGIGDFDGDAREVLILSPYIQTKENATVDEIDFNHSLIVDIDTLSNDISEQLKSMANNPIAQQSKLLIEYLAGKSFRNSDRVLHWLQMSNSIQKLPSTKVKLSPSMGSHTLDVINNIIREEMLTAEGDTVEVDSYRRNKAKEYKKRLDEEAYPDFGNPSDKGEIPDNPIPDDVPLPAGVEPMEETLTPHAQGESYATTDEEFNPKTLHSSIVEEIRNNQKSIDEALKHINKLENVLSKNSVDTMVETLKSYCSKNEEDVRDDIIDLLASHYSYVDSDYIKRNLEAAEKRLAKKAE